MTEVLNILIENKPSDDLLELFTALQSKLQQVNFRIQNLNQTHETEK
jgi:hypothetical protein